MTEQVNAKGSLEIIITDPEGKIKDHREIFNTVVNVGKDWIASRMVGTPAQMSHMAVGSDGTAAAGANTGLGSVLETAVALTAPGGAVTGNEVSYSATFPAAWNSGDVAISEAGIFNGSNPATATMLCRTAFGVVTKEPQDTITINWKIVITY